MQVPHTIMEKSVTVGSYIASVSTAIGGFLSLNNIALLIGIVTTVVLFMVQYRRSKAGKRQDAEYHAARMEALKHGVTIDISDGK